ATAWPPPGSPPTPTVWLSPARTASISRPSVPRSLSRSVSPVVRPCRLGIAVIGSPLRRFPIAWRGIGAHTASRVSRSRAPAEAKTGRRDHLKHHSRRLLLTTTRRHGWGLCPQAPPPAEAASLS